MPFDDSLYINDIQTPFVARKEIFLKALIIGSIALSVQRFLPIRGVLLPAMMEKRLYTNRSYRFRRIVLEFIKGHKSGYCRKRERRFFPELRKDLSVITRYVNYGYSSEIHTARNKETPRKTDRVHKSSHHITIMPTW